MRKTRKKRTSPVLYILYYMILYHHHQEGSSELQAFARAAGSVSTPIAQPVILPKVPGVPSRVQREHLGAGALIRMCV